MGIKLKNIPLTLAEFKKYYQALRTKLEQIEYLTIHKLNFQKKLKENKKMYLIIYIINQNSFN